VARLAKKAVAYYDSLPPALRTPETERNEAMAQARLALITAKLGDFEVALPAAQNAKSKLQGMCERAGKSDATVFSLGLAWEALGLCLIWQNDADASTAALEQAGATLKPLAHSPKGSARVKLEYAEVLNLLSHGLPPEQGMAVCEEALRLLEGIGALELSHLGAASAWADIADSEAREALPLGRIDEAERLEKQVQSVAEGVVGRRPATLWARKDLTMAPDVLGLIDARRYRDSSALQWLMKSREADEVYLKFNSSDLEGWIDLNDASYTVAGLLFRAGRATEALREAQAVVETGGSKPGLGFSRVGSLWPAIARWETQREDREAADRALREARRSYEMKWTMNRVPDRSKEVDILPVDDAERQVRLDFGENAAVVALVQGALPRLQGLRSNWKDPETSSELLFFQREAVDQATRACLRMGQFAEAERTARALVALQLPACSFSDRLSMDRPADAVWGQVLLAEAIARQGRREEALRSIEPALAHYRDMRGQGATHVVFRQRFARALYVHALAQPNSFVGDTTRRDSLDQAVRLLNDLSDEARQLHDTKELVAWIQAEQQKLSTGGAAP
jgi:tetratricopeptide (TPR) repeat protein